MDVSGYTGSGRIGTYTCENLDDQYYYIRSRGSVIGTGKLVNEKSAWCMDVAGYSGQGSMDTY